MMKSAHRDTSCSLLLLDDSNNILLLQMKKGKQPVLSLLCYCLQLVSVPDLKLGGQTEINFFLACAHLCPSVLSLHCIFAGGSVACLYVCFNTDALLFCGPLCQLLFLELSFSSQA